MGLDWVVIAKTVNGKEINPTEVFGAKRASKSDPEVVQKLREIHSARGERSPFDEWLHSLIEKEPPPIVISFGTDCRDAIPGVQAEVQYYGFRGKALEPEINKVSAFAVAEGRSMDWLWKDHDTADQIRDSIRWLSDILQTYSASHRRAYELAKRRFDSWRCEDIAEVAAIDGETSADANMEDEVFAIFAYLSAVLWLTFWQDKGFKIAADF